MAWISCQAIGPGRVHPYGYPLRLPAASRCAVRRPLTSSSSYRKTMEHPYATPTQDTAVAVLGEIPKVATEHARRATRNKLDTHGDLNGLHTHVSDPSSFRTAPPLFRAMISLKRASP